MIILTSPAEILEMASSFVLEQLAKHLDPEILFHNQRHTVQCVHAVQDIADALELSPSDRTAVQMAAWFQNVGFIQNDRSPIDTSIEMLEQFVEQYEIESVDVELIKACLLSVHDLDKNHEIAHGVFHDAYWYFLSASNHLEMCDRLRGEWSFRGKTYDDLGWRDFVCDLYKQPRYVTSYGRNVLEKRKQVNYYMCLTRLYGVAV